MWIKNENYKVTSLSKTIIAIIIISIAFNIASIMFPSSITERYDIAYTIDDGGSSRWYIWESVLQNYSNSTLFNQMIGTGAGTIRHHNHHNAVAHNIIIESLVEIGIVGTFILLIFYIAFFKKALKMKEYVVASSFLGYMIMTMSLSLYSYKPIWNIILLIILLINREYAVRNVNTNIRNH